MHYFKRNIGDYAKKAGRLSMLQHGSYTLLIDACYDREQFPTHAEAIEWTWASTTDEREAVEFVLHKFFTLIDGVYVQLEIQADIAEYHAKSEINKRIAIERETNRKAKSTNRAPAVNEAPPNHKPITTNQEPVLKIKPTVEAIAPTRLRRTDRPDGALEVFTYWQQVLGHTTTKLDAKRVKAIKGRLADGYTVADLCQAIDGCKYDPFSQGQNDRQTVYDEIAMICRDGPKVDHFRKIAERGPPNGRSANQNKTISNLQAYLDAHEN